jgi:hypothetical protein
MSVLEAVFKQQQILRRAIGHDILYREFAILRHEPDGGDRGEGFELRGLSQRRMVAELNAMRRIASCKPRPTPQPNRIALHIPPDARS